MRERLGEPILVRAGRGMLLTPRALALKPRVHQVVMDARRTLEPERPFVPGELSRTFLVHATDYVFLRVQKSFDHDASTQVACWLRVHRDEFGERQKRRGRPRTPI